MLDGELCNGWCKVKGCTKEKTVPYKTVPYVWEDLHAEISKPKKEKVSLEVMGTWYHRSKGNISRYYNRGKRDRNIINDAKKTEKKLAKAKKNDKVYKDTIISNDKGKKVRLPKYGKLEVTHYRSNLSFSEWRIKFAKRDPKWELPYINDIAEMYFRCINDYQFEMPFVPRDYGKTFIGIDFITYIFLEYNNIALVITSGGGSKRRFFNAVVRIIKSNIVRQHYGDIIESISKSDSEIWVVEELKKNNSIDPDFRVTGRLGDVIGIHADIIFLEDFIQLPYKSYESEEGLREWISNVVVPMNSPITGTGTRKSPEDAYQYLADAHNVKLRVHPALLTEGKHPTKSDFITVDRYHPKAGKIVPREVVNPEFDLSGFTHLHCPNYDLDSLLWRRAANIPAFESEMMQRPLPKTGNYFKSDKWETYNYELFNQVDYYIILDPGAGMTDVADRTSILVIGVYNTKAHIVNGFTGRIGFDEQIKKILQFNKKYNARYIVIEKIRNQQFQYQQLQYLPNVIPFTHTATNAKIMRIDAMEPYYEKGLIVIKEGIQPLPQMYTEYMQYDQRQSTATKKDDNIDALSMFIMLFGKYLGEKKKKSTQEWYLK